MKPNFEQYKDIPGTTIFTIELARQGFHLNQFCMSLRSEENRKRFLADNRAYLDEWDMTEEQKQAVIDRDFQKMLDLGGN
ncbi:MAG: protocatechuate 4,5-dioxygenase subunit alpha/beta, partial [Aurantimicrobium sp.]